MGKLKAIDNTISTSNVYIFQIISYRNCLPDAPDFYLVCPDHCFLFFFCLLHLSHFFHPFLFFFVILIDTSTTSASVSVCLQFRNNWWLPSMWFQNLRSAGACSFAETVDWLNKLGRELPWRGHWWPTTKLTRRWLWMHCWNCSIPCLYPHFKKYFSKTTSLA